MVEERLGDWRKASGRRGMKVSRAKADYLMANEKETEGTMRMQGQELKKCD